MKEQWSWMDIAGISYLYAPVVLFLLTWTKAVIAIPIVLLLCGVWYLLIQTKRRQVTGPCLYDKRTFLCSMALFVLVLAWCGVAGIGGYAKQASDHVKHNVILSELIAHPWPVRYDFHGKGVLSYYIGAYLMPAMVGKGTSFSMAQNAMLLWSAVGVFFACILVYEYIGIKKAKYLFVILYCLFFFSTFRWVLTMFSETFLGIGDANDYWFGSTIRIQYSPHIVLMRWVFPQWIASAIATALFLKHQKNYETWVLIAAPLLLHATFTFVGLGALMVITFMIHLMRSHEKKAVIKSAFGKINLLSIPICMVLGIYIIGNMLQYKPATAQMGFHLVDYTGEYITLVIFELSWMLWLFVLPKERKYAVLSAAALVLFALPFFSMGTFNDLCMRSSIPALFVLCVLLTKRMVMFMHEKKRMYAVLIAVLMLLCAFEGIPDLWEGIGSISPEQTYAFMSPQDYYLETDYHLYQYISWQPEILLNSILK